MAKESGYLYSVDKFFKFQAFDMVMFGYICGVKRALPTISVAKAIEMFSIAFNLCEDLFCQESARMQYYRILKASKVSDDVNIDEEQ